MGFEEVGSAGGTAEIASQWSVCGNSVRMNDPERDPDDLLASSPWLRRFVGTLVALDDADDLAQATRLAALQAPPPAATEWRRWLAGIGRNLARMLHRSRARSQRALARLPRGGESPSAADLVQGLEVQRAVSEAMLALPEPTRTILVLRYQHDLPPAAIALRVGLQEPAVRQRLHRGREEVRARLQQRFGADWRGSFAVLAFVGQQAVRRGAGAVLLAGAAALAIVVASTFLLAATSLPAVALSPARVEAFVGGAEIASGARDATPSSGELAREPVLSAQGPHAPASERKVAIRGRLVAAESGAPLAGTAGLGDEAKTPTAANGTFTVSLPGAHKRAMLWLHSDGRCPRWHQPQPKQDCDLGDVPMVLGYPVRGLLVDEGGAPLADVRVEAPIDGAVPGGGTIGFVAETDGRGAFAFRERLPAGGLVLRLGDHGLELLDGEVQVAARLDGNVFVLHAKRRRAIRGHVFTSAGWPCAGVELEAVVADLHSRQPKVVGSGFSRVDGSFELFEFVPGLEQVELRTPIHGGHDLLGDAKPVAWTTNGVRLEARARLSIRLTLVEEASRRAVERCQVVRTWSDGKRTIALPDGDDAHEGGVVAFAGVANGCRIELWPTDPMLAPLDLVVDESMRDEPDRVVEFTRLQPFALQLVDTRGKPVAAECSLLDRCGAPDGAWFTDRRAGRIASGATALRLSTTSTDERGQATLLAPISRRELVVAVRVGKKDLWLPVQPKEDEEKLRLVIPD